MEDPYARSVPPAADVTEHGENSWLIERRSSVANEALVSPTKRLVRFEKDQIGNGHDNGYVIERPVSNPESYSRPRKPKTTYLVVGSSLNNSVTSNTIDARFPRRTTSLSPEIRPVWHKPSAAVHSPSASPLSQSAASSPFNLSPREAGPEERMRLPESVSETGLPTHSSTDADPASSPSLQRQTRVLDSIDYVLAALENRVSTLFRNTSNSTASKSSNAVKADSSQLLSKSLPATPSRLPRPVIQTTFSPQEERTSQTARLASPSTSSQFSLFFFKSTSSKFPLKTDNSESNSSELLSPRIPTSPIKPPPTISRKQISPIISHVNVISTANHASRFPMRTSSLSHNSAHAGMDAESMMNIPRRNINKRLQPPKGLKRYALATADFYNADFSSSTEPLVDASNNVDSSGTDTELQSGAVGESLLDDDGEKVISHGSVFISALNDVSRVRLTAEENSEDTTTGGQDSGGVDIAEKSRLEGKGDPRMQYGLPEVDYSELFPRILGHRQGLEIFRMEAFKPVPVSDEAFGTFCVGDCYVVLWSREANREDDGKDLLDLAAIMGLNEPRSHRIIESRMLNRGKKRRRGGRGSYRASPVPLSRPESSLGGDFLSASISAASESVVLPPDAQPGRGTQSKRSSVRWSLATPDDGSTLATDPDRIVPRRPATRQSTLMNKRSSRSSVSSSKAPSDEDLSMDSSSYYDGTSDFDDGFDDDAYSYMDDESNLSHHIYTWIGSAAELDKRFCSAMYAVALRNLLGSSSRIQRETQEDESAEFKALFGGSVSHEEDTGRAAESALFVAASQTDGTNDNQADSENHSRVRKRPLRLYRVLQNRRGARDVVLRLVEPVASSLSSDTVYILDTGARDIIQWNGSAAGLNMRSKCRMLVGRMNGASSSGKTSSRSLEYDEGSEPNRFWDLLQGQTPQHVETSEDDLFWDLAQRPATLYRVTSNLDPEPQSHIIAIETDGGPASRASSPSWANRSTSPGTEGERSTPDQQLPGGLMHGLKRTLLDSRYCYVLDAGVEMFLWIGKDSPVSLRENVTELLARLVAIGSRPKWIALHKCVEAVEPDVFKLRFPDWDASRVAKVNWMAILNGEQSEDEHDSGTGRKKATTPSKMRVDVRALYAPPPKLNGIAETEDETSRGLQLANARLVNMSCFVYTKSRGGRFVTLPNSEKGHFFDQDAYLFLCAYRVVTSETDTSTLRPDTPDRSLLSPLPSSRRSSWRNSGRLSAIRRFSQNSSTDIKDRATPPQSSSPGTSVTISPTPESAESMKVAAVSVPLDPNIPPPPALPPPLITTGVKRKSDLPLETPLTTARSEYSPIKLPDVECVVYFWPGQRSSKLACSTFKLKMQAEMEALVKELYHCSVRVEMLEPGREPLQLLAHFCNKLVIHRGKSDEASTLFSPSRDERSSDRKQQTQSGLRMYHIRTDLRHGSTRAIEVTADASSLVMRDCFFVHGPSYNGFDGILQSSVAFLDPEMLSRAAFLWTGRGASKEEIRLAHSICERIVERRQRQWMRQSEETGVVDLNGNDDRDDPSRMFERAYLSIEEGSEPRLFWEILGITMHTTTPPTAHGHTTLPVPVYGRGAEYHFRPIPRMLRCSCASGYFLVEEIVHYQQRDLQTDSCVILDPGAPLRAYVWVGREASDVVLKLTRKSVEVWFERLNDGRVVLDSFTSISALTSPKRTGIAMINDSRNLVMRPSVVTSSTLKITPENTLEESMAQARAAGLTAISDSIKVAQASSTAYSVGEQMSSGKREDDTRESDVVWAVHGREPIEFRAFFHGWDEELMVGDTAIVGRSPVVVIGAAGRGSGTAAISGGGTGGTSGSEPSRSSEPTMRINL